MLDKIKSLWWRFPAKEDSHSEAGRFVLKKDAAGDVMPKKNATIPITGKTAYPKQRRYPRYPLHGMDIHAHMVITEEVDLQNISVNGVCIYTKKHLQPGRTYLLKIRDEKMSRSIKCTAIWIHAICCDDNSMRKEFIAGLQFHNIASDEIVRLKDFMRTFGIPDGEKVSDEYLPTALRFRIKTTERAVLYYHKTSPVKKISLGGMLMEGYNEIKLEWRAPMALFLPNENAPLKFRGRVASCIEITGRRSRHYDIGVEFLEMPEHDRFRLSDFLHLL